MAFSLIFIREALMPGVWATLHRDEKLTIDTLPYLKFPRLYALWVCQRINTIDDISNLPRSFTESDGIRNEEWLESAGWEYPQGAGRLRPELEVKPEDLNAEGKVETFRLQRNDPRKELDTEISRYFAWRSGVEQ